MAAKTNIVYLVLDGDNNPTEFAAIDAETNEYINVENLDPQTRNVATGFAGASALDVATRAAVTDNSATWNTHVDHGVSAVGFQKWNQTTTDMASVSGNIATNTGNITDNTQNIAQVAAVSANIATNAGNITTNTAAIEDNTQNIAQVAAVSANIATNAAAIEDNTQNIAQVAGVSGNIATNTGNITTNTNAIAVLDDDVDYLGTTSAIILTNTGNISTNLGKINVLDDDVDVLGTVSGNIATNAGNITTNTAAIEDNTQNIAQVASVSANIATNAGNITTNTAAIEDNTQNIAQVAAVSANIATNAGNITTNTAAIEDNTQNIAQVAAVSANIATNAGNITTLTTSATALNFWTADLGSLSGSLILTRGGGNLSAVEVSAAGEATANLSVPTFKRGPNKIAWQVPAFTVDPTAKSIEIADYYGTNLDLNLMTGGTSKLTASGIEAKSIETNTFSSDNVTASAYALQVGTSLGCPIPNPFGYIQLTSDDAASSDEKHVGYSNTPTTVLSNTDHISWDDSAKNFVVKFAGTYEVVARVFFEGGSTLIEMHINKEGSPVNTANPRAHTTVDPVERTISAIFTCAIDDVVDVTYEATSAQTTAAQIGTTVTIKRLK